MRRLKNARGMTLVEVVVSMALAAIAIIIIASSVASAQILIMRGIQLERNSAASFSAEELRENSTPGTVTFTVGGSEFEAAGNYVWGESEDVRLTAFDPSGGDGGA